MMAVLRGVALLMAVFLASPLAGAQPVGKKLPRVAVVSAGQPLA